VRTLVTKLIRGIATEQDVLLTLRAHASEDIYLAYTDELAATLLRQPFQQYVAAHTAKFGLVKSIERGMHSLLHGAAPLFTAIGYAIPTMQMYASIATNTASTWVSITRAYPALIPAYSNFSRLLSRGFLDALTSLKNPQLEDAMHKTFIADKAETNRIRLQCFNAAFLSNLIPVEPSIDGRWLQLKSLLDGCGLSMGSDYPAGMDVLRASYAEDFRSTWNRNRGSMEPLIFSSDAITEFLSPYLKPPSNGHKQTVMMGAHNEEGPQRLEVSVDGSTTLVSLGKLTACSMQTTELTSPHRWPDIAQASAQTKSEILAWMLRQVTNTYAEAVCVIETAGIPWDIINQKTPGELAAIPVARHIEMFLPMLAAAPEVELITWQL
jgi:hypothetical protein